MKIENFNEQRRIIRQSNTSIQYLEDYAENMRTIFMELQSVWEKNPDRNYTLQAFVSCVNSAADIVHDYSTFSVNAISFIGQIEKLDKIVKGKWLSGHNFVKKLDRVLSGTYKNQIRVNSQTLTSYAAKVNGLGAKLDSTRVKTDSINAQVDNLIMQQFLNSKSSLSEINKRIKKLQKLNSQLSNALNQIVEVYQTEEQKLKVAADVVVNKGESSGQVDVTIQKAFTEERDKIQYTMPEVRTYKLELGEIAEKTDSEDILQFIQNRNGGIPQPERNGCTRYTRDKLAVLGINLVSAFGHGKSWYDNLKNGNTLTAESKEKVDIDAYPGDEFWDKLNNGNIKQPIYNLVISYRGGATANAQQYGHVLFIDAIVDGKVYYTDNWGVTRTPQAISITDFYARYKKQNYEQQGVIHFTEKIS